MFLKPHLQKKPSSRIIVMIRPIVKLNNSVLKRIKDQRSILFPLLCKYHIRKSYSTLKIQKTIAKVGVSADPKRLQEITRVHYHPWKVLIKDIYPSLNEFDIESAILDVCNNVSITDIEIFHVRMKEAIRKFAFVSFASEDDMNLVNRCASKNESFEKLGEISCISNIDNERTLMLQLPPAIRKEKDVFDILESLDVQKRYIEYIYLQKITPRYTMVNIRFNKHEYAFVTWQKIKDANMRDLKANWYEKIDIHRRSSILSFYSNYLQQKKLEVENIIVEERKVDNKEETIPDYRLNNMIYNHIIKALEYTNYDKKRTLELLKISSQKFTWIIKSLKEDGYNINIA